jgi:hypothetical protein
MAPNRVYRPFAPSSDRSGSIQAAYLRSANKQAVGIDPSQILTQFGRNASTEEHRGQRGQPTLSAQACDRPQEEQLVCRRRGKCWRGPVALRDRFEPCLAIADPGELGNFSRPAYGTARPLHSAEDVGSSDN